MSSSHESIRPHPSVGSELVRRWSTDPGSKRGSVVLVHGISEHTGRYEHVGEQLIAAGYDVTGFDLIGHGATAGKRGHIENWADYLDQVEAHVTEAREEAVALILLGHSMGGLIAAEYVLSDRPQPDLLVLSAPAMRGGAAWQVKLAPTLSTLAPHLSVPSLIKGAQLSRDVTVGERYFDDPLVNTSATSRLGAELFSAMARVRACIGDITIPTLVIHGSSDTICSVEATAAVPGDRIVYHGLRHELFNEPEGSRVLADVIGWINHQIDSADEEGGTVTARHAQK